MRKGLLKNITDKFFLAPVSDKKTYAYALVWSMIVRFCMVFLPFRFYKKLLGNMQVEARQEINTADLELARHIKNIVLTVCSHTPWNSECMVQAVICKRLLEKKGLHSTIYLGIAKEKLEEKLKAHAWLKVGDTILTGARGHKEYKVVNYYS